MANASATMVNWIRKLLLLTALIVLPVQGYAMAVTFVTCHDQTSPLSASQDHHHAPDSAAHDHSETNNSGSTGGSSGHLCGHHVVFHLPAFVSVGTIAGFPVWAAPPSLDYTPHFPEQPRRPPRA